MTNHEAVVLVGELKRVFDIVRLVDVSLMNVYSIDEDGIHLEGEHKCFEVWNKCRRCENCISAKAFSMKSKLSKFEFVDHDIYHVVSKYITIDDQPFMLEMVSTVTDETLFGAYGKDSFVDTLEEYNKKLYIDPLTGAKNRRYYDEQLGKLSDMAAVAIVDLDGLRRINDRYGQAVGDEALKTVAKCLFACLRKDDTVVRYGCDDFVFVFSTISRTAFETKLERVRTMVEKSLIEECPELRLTVSIGGVCCDGQTGVSVDAADEMLREAKKRGNTVSIHWDDGTSGTK